MTESPALRRYLPAVAGFLAVAAVLAATLIPQRFLATDAQVEGWRAANRALLPLVDELGLHHVYTTPWFAGCILLASLSLLLTTFAQFRTAWRTSSGQ